MSFFDRILIASLLMHSLAAYAGDDCVRWFRDGKVLETPQVNPYVNVSNPGKADLRSQFVQLFVEGNRTQIIDEFGNVVPARDSIFLQTLVSRTNLNDTSLGPTVSRVMDTLIANSDIHKIEPRDFDEGYARRWLKNVLAYLYERYQKQGDERRLNVGTYQEEDVKFAGRTTHFTILLNGEVLSHVQAMSSRGWRQLLNFERHFGRATDRGEHELAFELGRLESVKWHLLSEGTRKALEAAGYTREIILLLTYQKALAWLNRDVHAPKVYFQVNASVFEILNRLVAPMIFEHTRQVRQSPNAPVEYVVKVDRAQLETIEDILHQRIVNHFFLRDYEIMRKTGKATGWSWNWIFWPNEVQSIQRMEFGSASRPYYVDVPNLLEIQSYQAFWGWFEKQIKFQKSEDQRPETLMVRLNKDHVQEYFKIASHSVVSPSAHVK